MTFVMKNKLAKVKCGVTLEIHRERVDHDLRRASEGTAGPPPKAIDPDRLQALETTVAKLAGYFGLPAERLSELREHVRAAAQKLYATTGHTYASALAQIERALTGSGFESAHDALRHFGEAASQLAAAPALPASEVDWSAIEVPAPAPRKRTGGYTRGLLRRLRRT